MSKKHAFIFGARGKVGSELVRAFPPEEFDVTAITRQIVDLQKPDHIRALLATTNANPPDVIVNAAAFNGMEACDVDPVQAFMTNSVAPTALASAACDLGAVFVHYSTDYVFSGQIDGFPLTEDDKPKPSGFYGFSKRAGEVGVDQVGGRSLILRVQAIYGRQFSGPIDAVNQVMTKGRGTRDNPVQVFHQYCAPTSAKLIAHGTVHAIQCMLADPNLKPQRILNFATSEGIWKKEFAEEVLARVLKTDDLIVKEGTLSVPRPIHSFLDSRRFEETFGFRIPTWREDLDSMLPLLPSPNSLKTA